MALVALSGVIAGRAPLGLDYAAEVTNVDSARPQIDALADLDLRRFAREQSPLGPVSLVLRAPFAALAPPSDQLSRYRLGSFPCVLALALAALGIAMLMRSRGSPLWHCVLAVGVIVLAPPMTSALDWGHPEELLTTALIVAVALNSEWKARTATAVIAVATKPWAALAVPAVAFLRRHGAVRSMTIAWVVGALLIAPLAVANADAFHDATQRANRVGLVKPQSVWWPLSGHEISVKLGNGEVRTVHQPELPSLLERMIRPAIFVLAVAFALLAARASPMTLERVFLLLAFVFLARCMLDPGDHPYYHVPFIASLAAAEGLRGRPPIVALITGLLLADTTSRALGSDPDAINVLYLAWSIPLAAGLAWALLRQQRAPSVDRNVGAA